MQLVYGGGKDGLALAECSGVGLVECSMRIVGGLDP